jgi:hypothetical protein
MKYEYGVYAIPTGNIETNQIGESLQEWVEHGWELLETGNHLGQMIFVFRREWQGETNAEKAMNDATLLEQVYMWMRTMKPSLKDEPGVKQALTLLAKLQERFKY